MRYSSENLYILPGLEDNDRWNIDKLNVKRPNREQLLDIKSGNMDYDDLLAMADKLMESIESYCSTSILPDAPDKDLAETVLVEMREALYK